MLMAFNRVVASILPYIDLAQVQNPTSIASRLADCRALIIPTARSQLWDKAIKLSKVRALPRVSLGCSTAHRALPRALQGSGSNFQLQINRMKGIQFRSSGEVDTVRG